MCSCQHNKCCKSLYIAKKNDNFQHVLPVINAYAKKKRKKESGLDLGSFFLFYVYNCISL